MPPTAHTATSNAPGRPFGPLTRVARLGLIGMIVVPFALGSQLGLAASTNSMTVVANADAQIRSYFPNRNYGTGDHLRARIMAGDQLRTLLRFTLPTLTGKVQSVQLRLYVRDKSVKGGVVHRVAGSWTETTVTWNKAPAIDPA
ncbi:MAG: DNRLRE domain-containing protein, partial [Chloroflexota bacterium]|nr:DNRLRE domain-containing protein [Chloroflexota bacterium]